MFVSRKGKARTREYVIAFFQNDKVRKYMKDAIKKTAKNLGIDEEFVLKGMKDIAETSKSDKVKLEAFRDIGELLGMYNQVESEGGGEWDGMSLAEGEHQNALPAHDHGGNALPPHMDSPDEDFMEG